MAVYVESVRHTVVSLAFSPQYDAHRTVFLILFVVCLFILVTDEEKATIQAQAPNCEIVWDTDDSESDY